MSQMRLSYLTNLVININIIVTKTINIIYQKDVNNTMQDVIIATKKFKNIF